MDSQNFLHHYITETFVLKHSVCVHRGTKGHSALNDEDNVDEQKIEATSQAMAAESENGKKIDNEFLQIGIVSASFVFLILAVALWQKHRNKSPTKQHQAVPTDEVAEIAPCQAKLNLTKSLSFRTANDIRAVECTANEEEMEGIVESDVEIEVLVR